MVAPFTLDVALIEPNVETPDAGAACETQLVPLDTNTFPVVPGASVCIAPVPFPIKTAFAVNELAPVPPFVTLNALVKLNEPALNEVPMMPLPLILKLEVACCVV
jgi:hypothetical protein